MSPGVVDSVCERGVDDARAHLVGAARGGQRAEGPPRRRRDDVAAESVCATIGLDGVERPARLPATAGVFASGGAGLRHVEVIARVLDTGAARRLPPQTWAGAEAQLAAKAAVYTPAELHTWGSRGERADRPADEFEPAARSTSAWALSATR